MTKKQVSIPCLLRYIISIILSTLLKMTSSPYHIYTFFYPLLYGSFPLISAFQKKAEANSIR
ncbi:hypothetical protein BLOT_000498 [Blomia tropicalis]|nr:hypothetical protein BLOT_000498 [Blomia tropicalis]